MEVSPGGRLADDEDHLFNLKVRAFPFSRLFRAQSYHYHDDSEVSYHL